VTAVVFSPNGKLLASAGDDDTVRVWDIATGDALDRFRSGRLHSQGLTARDRLEFSSDGKRLASAQSCGGEVHVWNPVTGQSVAELSAAGAVAFKPQGNLLVTGGGAGAVRLLNRMTGRASGEPLTRDSADLEPLCDLQFSPDGTSLAAVTDSSLRLLATIATDPGVGHAGAVNDVRFSPDGRILASAGDDGTVRLWDQDTSRPIGEPLMGHTRSVVFLTFSPNGKLLASVDQHRITRLWKVPSGASVGPPLKGAGLEFRPDSRVLALLGGEGRIHLWDTRANSPVGLPLPGRANTAHFSPNGKWLVTDYNGVVRFWDARTGHAVGSRTLRGGPVAFHPDGNQLAVLTESAVKLWNVPPVDNQTAGTTYRAEDSLLFTHAFSADGRFLAASNDRAEVILWDSSTKKAPIEIVSGKTTFDRLLFSPSGRTLALGGRRTVSLWDLRTSQLVAERLPWNAVSFGPNDLLASGGNDGTVQFWRGLLDVETACSLVQQRLSIDQIRAYVPTHQEAACRFTE
jgi:WD40 repeat protein